MLICPQFKQDTPRQLVHKLVHGISKLLASAVCMRTVGFATTLDNFSNSTGAIFFVISIGITPLCVIFQPQSRALRSLSPFILLPESKLSKYVVAQHLLLLLLLLWSKCLRCNSPSRCANKFVKILLLRSSSNIFSFFAPSKIKRILFPT